MTCHVSHRFLEATSIVHAFAAVVETKDLLIEVRIKVKRLNRNIRSLQSPLQQTPEVFDALRVYLAAHIFLHVIHRLMDIKVSRIQTLIAEVLISVDLRSETNVLQNLVLQSLTLCIGDDHCANLAAVARPHTHYDSFLIAVHVSDTTLRVHVTSFSPDVSLINFNGVFSVPTEFSLPGLHHLADAVQHEPSRLLGNADCPGHLVARDAVFAVGHHPKGNHPLIESDGAVLEDCPYLEGELLLAGVAVPDFPGLDEGMLLLTASGAGYDPARPPQIEGVLEGPVRIGEVNDGLLECFRAFHDSKVRPNSLCVKSIITSVNY